MITRIVTFAGALLFTAMSYGAGPDGEALNALPNVRFPAENRIVSGAIDAADIARLREAGVKHVINLRTAEEDPQFDEAHIVKEQGLTYHTIPISGAQSLTNENAIELDRVLKSIGDEPALIHCASGNRVGALIALREAWINDRPAEDAVAEGKRWGLTKLEPAVREKLRGDEGP